MLETKVLTILVRGRGMEGFTKVRWVSSLNALVDSLTIEIPTEVVQGFAGGEEIEAQLDGELFFTGYVDSVELRVTGSEDTSSLVCRSGTADIVDSSVDLQTSEAELVDVTLQVVAQQYVRLHLGMVYEVKVDDLPRLPKVSIQVGETVFDVLDRYAKQSGVVLRTSPQGTLVIERVGGSAGAVPLTLGVEVSGFSLKRSVGGRFYRTKVVGQTANEDDFGATISTGEAIDEAIRPTRTRVIHADGPASADSCQREAEWSASVAVSRSSKIAVAVQGWTGGGRLLTPNTVVDLETNKYGRDARLVVHTAECEYSDQSGFKARLQLVYPGTFLTKPARQLVDDEMHARMTELGWGKSE